MDKRTKMDGGLPTMEQLKINPEFRDKIPPLTDEEKCQLEENILRDGEVYQPIITWNGTIVDGHNRWEIIQRHPEIPHKTKEMPFQNEYEAVSWICQNQLGRRNLTPEQKKYLIGAKYEAEKMAHGASKGFRGNQYTKVLSPENQDLAREKKYRTTADRVAHETGVSHDTVEKAGKFKQGVDTAESIAPGAKDAILSGKAKVPFSTVEAIPKMEPNRQAEVAAAIAEAKSIPKKESVSAPHADSRLYDEVPAQHDINTACEDFENLIKDFNRKFRRSVDMNLEHINSEADVRKVEVLLDEVSDMLMEVRTKINREVEE